MTIKVENIVYSSEPDFSYMPNVFDAPSEEDVLAMVRQIMRDRNDCSIIPVVNASALVERVNEYGHNLFIDVTYSKRGWRAVYAARLTDGGVSALSCYMD